MWNRNQPLAAAASQTTTKDTGPNGSGVSSVRAMHGERRLLTVDTSAARHKRRDEHDNGYIMNIRHTYTNNSQLVSCVHMCVQYVCTRSQTATTEGTEIGPCHSEGGVQRSQLGRKWRRRDGTGGTASPISIARSPIQTPVPHHIPQKKIR